MDYLAAFTNVNPEEDANTVLIDAQLCSFLHRDPRVGSAFALYFGNKIQEENYLMPLIEGAVTWIYIYNDSNHRFGVCYYPPLNKLLLCHLL